MRTYTFRWPVRMPLLLALTALAASLGLPSAHAAGGASAMSVLQVNPIPGPFDDANVTDPCRGINGTINGVMKERSTFYVTTTGGEHFLDDGNGSYRIDYVDGSYALGDIGHHIAAGTTAPGESTWTEVYRDTATVYDAAGRLLGTESGQDVNHHSVQDGVIQETFDQPWLHGEGAGPVSCSI